MILFDRQLQVYSNGTLIGYITANDGLTNCNVTKELNGISTLTFDLPLDSPKWSLLENNIRIRVDGKEYCFMNPKEQKREDGLMGHVEMSETVALLGRRYPTVSEVPLAVQILSGEPGEGGFDAGSAGSALYRLLTAGGTTPPPPTFTRSSPAYNPEDGSQVAVNEPRYVDGPFSGSKAVMVEEGTTNQIATPTTFAGWSIGGGVVLDNDGSFYPSQAKFARVTTTTWGFQSNSIPAANGQTWSVSYIARKGTGNGEPLAAIMIMNTSNSHVSNINPTFSFRDIGGGWVRYEATFMINREDTGYIRLRFYVTATNGGYHDFALPQLEQKPFATSFIDGPRYPETPTIPTAGVLNPQEGTWEQWVYVNEVARRQVAGQYPNVFYIRRADGGNGILVYHSPTSPNWVLETRNDANQSRLVSVPDSHTPDGWHLFRVTWKQGDKATLSIDGVELGVIDNPNLPSGFYPEAYVGQQASIYYLNTAHADIRLSSIARTDDSDLVSYQNRTPLPVDEWTTYKLSLNGHLNPDKIGGYGWSVGTVDVSGTFDLETEKMSLLENIFEVQKIWGGWLVFDSINKTVSLRDDELWQRDTGFELRYAKNEKTLTKIEDWETVVTKLYPFGEKDLNIAAVNDGKIYLENYSFTSEIREGIWRREDIYDQQKLKEEAIKHLEKVCRPRVQYSADMLDLRTLSDYNHELFDLGDIITIQDEELGKGVKVRLIYHSYDVLQPWKCSIKLGDPMKPFAELATAASVADWVQTNLRPSKSLNQLKVGLINTFYTLIESADGTIEWNDSSITFIETQNGVPTGKRVRLTSGGLGISKDGGQTYVTAITGEGILADKIIVNDLFALSSEDTYTKMNGSGIHVYDDTDTERLHLGHWIDGTHRFGLKVRNQKGDIVLDDQGILQTWQDHLVDNVDSTHPLMLNLYLPNTTLSIVNARLRLKLAAFRAYEKSAMAGGDHRHLMFNYLGKASGDREWHAFQAGDSLGGAGTIIHVQSPGGLYQTYTKGASGTHTHDIDFGIYEGTTATGVRVTINGTDRTSALGGPFNSDQNDLNIAPYLVAGQWNTIILSSTRLGRIDATVFLQAKMTT